VSTLDNEIKEPRVLSVKLNSEQSCRVYTDIVNMLIKALFKRREMRDQDLSHCFVERGFAATPASTTHATSAVH